VLLCFDLWRDRGCGSDAAGHGTQAEHAAQVQLAPQDDDEATHAAPLEEVSGA
jgi:hypothetical protein